MRRAAGEGRPGGSGRFVLQSLPRSRRNGGPRVQPPSDRATTERHLDCPQCHARMDTHPYEGPGNVVVDSCSICYLIWLDSGEILRIVRAPDHHYADDTYGV
jgi:hypothetical protein